MATQAVLELVGIYMLFIFILQATKSFFIIFYSHLLSELMFCKAA